MGGINIVALSSMGATGAGAGAGAGLAQALIKGRATNISTKHIPPNNASNFFFFNSDLLMKF